MARNLSRDFRLNFQFLIRSFINQIFPFSLLLLFCSLLTVYCSQNPVHRSPLLIRPFSEENNGDGCKDNFQVKDEGLVLDVIKIEPDHVMKSESASS